MSDPVVASGVSA